MNMNPELMKLVMLLQKATGEEIIADAELGHYIDLLETLDQANLHDPEQYPWRNKQDGYSKSIRNLIGHFPMVTPVATVVALNKKGQILLERRSDNGKWTIPSGIIEPGESAKDCAARELYEETGLMVDQGDLHLFDEFSGKQHVYPHGDVIWSVKLIYIVKRFWGDPKPNFESTELAWFHLDAIPETASGSTKKIAVELLGRDLEIDRL